MNGLAATRCSSVSSLVLGSARTPILSDRVREAPPDPTLPSGPILVRPKPNEGPGGGSTTATLVEWSVVGSRSGIRRTSRESRLQGIAPSGKPYLRFGVWPIRGPVLSWAFASPGGSPPASWGRLHDPIPRDRWSGCTRRWVADLIHRESKTPGLAGLFWRLPPLMRSSTLSHWQK